MNPIIKLKFSEKYDQQHATQYLIKHHRDLCHLLHDMQMVVPQP